MDKVTQNNLSGRMNTLMALPCGHERGADSVMIEARLRGGYVDCVVNAEHGRFHLSEILKKVK